MDTIKEQFCQTMSTIKEQLGQTMETSDEQYGRNMETGIKKQYDRTVETLITPVRCNFPDPSRQWRSSFRQIDSSSWIIFNKAILTQLPLGQTKEGPNDYVDHKEGFIYRIRELGDDEARPATTTGIPNTGPVRPNPLAWRPMYLEYRVGSTGCLKFMPAKADANHVNHHALEHENIEFAAEQGPKHFRVPRVVYHIEAEGKYSILTERVGTPVLDRPIPTKFLMRLWGQVAKAVAEMAQWEAPSVQGVNGKDIQWRIVEHVVWTAFSTGRRASDCAQEYLAGKGFTMSPCGFLNGDTGLGDVGLDQDFNLVGFNTWRECAFVPKGYIMPFVLYSMDFVAPREHPLELPSLKDGLRRVGTACITSKMIEEGLPDETGSFYEVLLEEKALGATYRQRWENGMPGHKALWMFPDNDPDYRPEIYDEE